MTSEEPLLRVAVVGAGPAGLYAADVLTFGDGPAAEVDLIERLPTPFGLLRYGVAPDHLNIKAAGNALSEVLSRPQVRLFANVSIGSDVTIDEIRERYDAVIYACGASADRALGIAGEDLPGSDSATSFVSWYNGHPERIPSELAGAQAVAVIGVGNVALDVARILLKDPADLEHTDVPQDVIDGLRDSKVTDVHIVGRRGPQFAKFTTKELRELGELGNVDVLVDRADLPDAVPTGLTANETRNLAVLTEWSTRTPQGRPRRLHLHFQARPHEILGVGQVRGLRLERTEADGARTGATFDLDVQMVLRSVGYRATPVPGLPFDDQTNTIPTADHRVLRDSVPSPGEYAVGWIKRGPTGILGTNRKDANETIEALLADAGRLIAQRASVPERLDNLLARRGVRFVDLARWVAITQAEADHGRAHGRGRVKIAEWPHLLRAAGLAELADSS